MTDIKLSKIAFADDPIQGGTSIIAFGSFGAGKSKLLQSWAVKAFKRGHLVILRSKDVDTWQDLASEYPIHVYSPDFYHFDFDDPGQNRNIKYSLIRRPDDIVSHLSKDEINVIVVLGSEFDSGFFWSWFSKSLIHHAHTWTTFIFDELRDVFQSHPSGPSYNIYESFVNAMTSFRKKRIHFRASTHTFHDLYYEILYKFQYTAYLKGAILLPKKRTALDYTTPIKEAIDREHYILDNISEFEVVEHLLLPENLATSLTVSIEGKDFDASNFPLELLSMGIHPMVQCPACGRSFHASSPKLSCPICKEPIEIVDSIARTTPEVEYDGENPPKDTPLTPLSIEETSENPAPLSRPASPPRKPRKSIKLKKSEQKTKRSKHKIGRENQKIEQR